MKVVIVGAGFAGLRLARKLNNKEGFDVLLIDKYNYHQFQPLFYQVATAALDASNISFPLRKAFHKSRNVRIRVEELREVRAEQKVIVTESETITYDVLVLALGADTNFFGNQNVTTNAFPMKSTVEAIQLRHRFIQNFEDAVRAGTPEDRQRLMNIIIAGGGPTGVELAGALAEMRKYVLPCDYPELDFKQMKIMLLDGGERLLGAMDPKSSADAQHYLEKLGVEVHLKTIVKDYDGRNVQLADGGSIASEMVIWAAGIRGNVPAGIDKSLVVRGNRITVDRYNRVQGIDGVYVLGDLASMVTPRYPNGHPQVASAAIQQAENLAHNLRAQQKGEALREYEYKDKGSMATVGRNLAVVDVPKPKLHFRGLLAWLVWMGLHLFLILGVKNRLFVFLNWVYSYITYDQSLRLIFKEFYRPKQPTDATKQAQVNPAGT
ncbi:MAG: NAD(P)/FAD-dependent oxidoreductase [Chitinophagaceae bacterium]|nr:MAG: NAD(P)/FAD-dependent oxidoreductase [Chitinophagaceae bacterium]